MSTKIERLQEFIRYVSENDCEEYLTDRFFIELNTAFESPFESKWLLTGNGEKRRNQEIKVTQNISDNHGTIAGRDAFNFPPSTSANNSKTKSKPEFHLPQIPSWALILISSVTSSILFILFMILFQNIFGFETSISLNENTVLAFVGTAATFVVVSNYAQVKDIRNEFTKRTDDLQKDYNEKLQTVNQLKLNFEELSYKNNYILNDAIGRVFELTAENNLKEGFFLNVIQNYIGAIERYNLIKDNKKNRDGAIIQLKEFIRLTEWNNYDFKDELDLVYLIGKIETMYYISEGDRKDIIEKLRIILGIQKTQKAMLKTIN
ncbi:MAG: hypothetical protein LBJ17_08720 [Dysgonamonadaceae bacterium]|jgi:hypothetical protein|nr:hypothetical protein [Dysgonamonadaceae bacterium]